MVRGVLRNGEWTLITKQCLSLSITHSGPASVGVLQRLWFCLSLALNIIVQLRRMRLVLGIGTTHVSLFKGCPNLDDRASL
jgi:hypothetical protein